MEYSMFQTPKETIPGLLVGGIARNLILALEEALVVGSQRAHEAARGMAEGHLRHVLGQLRHFHMNESFHRALELGAASPTPLRGNSIIFGRSGIFKLARFNVREHLWINGRRSQIRRTMSMANKAMEALVQLSLFDQYEKPSEAVVFVVACFSGDQSEIPKSIQIALPDRRMQRWLFKEPIGKFLERYEGQPSTQEDLAKPRLKKSTKFGTDGSAS